MYINVLVSICIYPVFIIYTCIIYLQVYIIYIYTICIYWYVSIGCIIFMCYLYLYIFIYMFMSLSSASVFLTQISRIQLVYLSPGACFLLSAPTSCTVTIPDSSALLWVPSHVGAISHSQDQVVLEHQMSPCFLCSAGKWILEPLGGTESSLDAPWHITVVVKKPWES